MSSSIAPALRRRRPRRAGRFAMIAGAAFALLLLAGCGASREDGAGAAPAADRSAPARAVEVPVLPAPAAAGLTALPVESAAEVAERQGVGDQAAQMREACRARAYELILGMTSRKDAGGARRVTCLVLDLGDLSVRTVDRVEQ